MSVAVSLYKLIYVESDERKIMYCELHSVLSLQMLYLMYTWKDFVYRGPGKSLARPTSQCILSDGENILFDASLVIYINSTNIPPVMIINRIYEHQNLLSL